MLAGLQKGLLIWYTTPLDAPPPLKADKLAQVPTTPAAAAAAAAAATDSAAKPAPTTPPATSFQADITVAHPALAMANALLNVAKATAGLPPIPGGSSLTHAALRSRLAGNKVKGGMYLTAKEMEELTEPWRPFRSVGMWSVLK